MENYHPPQNAQVQILQLALHRSLKMKFRFQEDTKRHRANSQPVPELSGA